MNREHQGSDYEQLSAEIRAVSDEWGPGVQPVFYLSSRTGEELHGSCVLITYQKRFFAVTAAHVLKPLHNEHDSLFIGGQSRIRSVAPPLWCESHPPAEKRSRDPIDLAFFELTDEQAANLGEVRWFSTSDMELSEGEVSDHECYVAIGYPWRKAKSRPANREHRVLMYSYLDYRVDIRAYAQLNYSETKNLAISFNRKRVVSRAGSGVATVKPHGMSGGALIAVEASAGRLHVHSRPLAGILTAWHGGGTQLIVATRAVVLLEALRKMIPRMTNEK